MINDEQEKLKSTRVIEVKKYLKLLAQVEQKARLHLIFSITCSLLLLLLSENTLNFQMRKNSNFSQASTADEKESVLGFLESI